MIIKLSPVRSDDALKLERAGDILIVNGVEFDFTPLPDGATLPAAAIDSPFFSGPVSRVDGEIECVIMLPHGANAAQSVMFPNPIIDPPDGVVVLPTDEEA